MTALATLPDIANIDVDELSPEDCATLAHGLSNQVADARTAFEEGLAPITALIARARARVLHTITEAGGSMLAHDTFDVKMMVKTQRDKRIDVLRTLEGKLPDDLYHEAIRVKSLSGTLAPEIVKAAIEQGATALWDADLRKLDVHARKYGGEIAAIIERGSPKVEIGAPYLVIEPRQSALKAAGVV